MEAAVRRETMKETMEAQSFSVKRAQVEFHNFASLGEPERAARVYAEENARRSAVISNHLDFIGPMAPFLEIGANAAHTSYMLANEFGARGFALDISADALRHGIALQDLWGYPVAPVRVAGDALNLPFRDGSLRLVMAFQMLSQFMDIESVFVEVKRVLAPGGVFLFAEEPLRRLLTLRLYRCPYYDTMKPWERKLFDWGLLGYLVRDVIGAHQEESFGIRQNHTMTLRHWHALIRKHFTDAEYEIFVPRRGWGERAAYSIARRLDRHGSDWVPARLLGGTLAAVCRKAGNAGPEKAPSASPLEDRFETYLRCPDCRAGLGRDSQETLRCAACGYTAPNEGGVYNLIRAADRKELYPGDREDLIDFSQPAHAEKLLEGWYELEGVYGNKYRWIGARATARLKPVHSGRHAIRIRGHAHELSLQQGQPLRVEVLANGERAGEWTLDRNGLFVLEAPLPRAGDYLIEVRASPTWRHPDDDRTFTVNLSMIRLIGAN
jgi:ubiquinone/menaquinone biosynthesis C-methylase UbiE